MILKILRTLFVGVKKWIYKNAKEGPIQSPLKP